MLDKFGARACWTPKPFDPADWPLGTRVFYCYWCYSNKAGTMCKQAPKWADGKWWMRIKFDYLKQARWVPVTSHLGCHLGKVPFEGEVADTLYRGREDWQEAHGRTEINPR